VGQIIGYDVYPELRRRESRRRMPGVVTSTMFGAFCAGVFICVMGVLVLMVGA